MATSVIIFLPLILCISGIFGEPQCSPFHYHEQLLERMIDVKYKMDLLTNKMDKWETVISEKLEQIGKIVGQSKELERRITTEMENQQSSLNVKAEEMEGRITTEIENQHSYLNRTLTDFSETWKQTIGNQKTPSVLFKARAVKKRTASKGETVIFQTIVQNEGNGYNADTGIFTVPVTGTYLFTVQFCLITKKELGFNIIADGKVVTVANFGDMNWGGICTSTDGLAALNQGAEVKVQITYAYSGNVIYPDSNTRYWSYFSGTILHK